MTNTGQVWVFESRCAWTNWHNKQTQINKNEQSQAQKTWKSEHNTWKIIQTVTGKGEKTAWLSTKLKYDQQASLQIPFCCSWCLIYSRDVQSRSSRAAVLQVLDVPLLQQTWFVFLIFLLLNYTKSLYFLRLGLSVSTVHLEKQLRVDWDLYRNSIVIALRYKCNTNQKHSKWLLLIIISKIIISIFVSVAVLRLMGDVLVSSCFHSDSGAPEKFIAYFFFSVRNTMCGMWAWELVEMRISRSLRETWEPCAWCKNELLINFFFHKLKVKLKFIKVKIKNFFILAAVYGIIFIQCLHIVCVLSVTLLPFIIWKWPGHLQW